jgi:hypothetical protein
MISVELLSPIWVRLIGTPFNASNLAQQLLHDGGLDIQPLTKSDLISLMEGHFEGKWKDVTFSFSEMLAFYGDFDLSNVQAIGWCFSALMIGEASRKHETDWESHLFVLTIGFTHIKSVLTCDEFAAVLQHALSPFELTKAGRPDYGEVS